MGGPASTTRMLSEGSAAANLLAMIRPLVPPGVAIKVNTSEHRPGSIIVRRRTARDDNVKRGGMHDVRSRDAVTARKRKRSLHRLWVRVRGGKLYSQ